MRRVRERMISVILVSGVGPRPKTDFADSGNV